MPGRWRERCAGSWWREGCPRCFGAFEGNVPANSLIHTVDAPVGRTNNTAWVVAALVGVVSFDGNRCTNPSTALDSKGLFLNVLQSFLLWQATAKQLNSTMYATVHLLLSQQIFMHSSMLLTFPLSVKLPAPNPPIRSLFL